MRQELLRILQCPFCAGKLRLSDRPRPVLEPTASSAGPVLDGILTCDCCAYPVVGGIPYVRTGKVAEQAMQLLGKGMPGKALALLAGLGDDESLERLMASITFRESLSLLGERAENQYLLHRFSDPGFLVSAALVRTAAEKVLSQSGEDNVLDLCGGTGHLTRFLSKIAPGKRVVLADLDFWKLYLAKRFIAPRGDPICCNANEPLPFEPAQFSLSVCADAFHYIWSKRQLAAELTRATTTAGAVLLPHLHNSQEWNPSQGMPLPPEGYARLFRRTETRLFAEKQFLERAVNNRAIDLSERAVASDLASAPALVLVSSANASVFESRVTRSSGPGMLSEWGTPDPPPANGWRINPLYKETGNGELILTFPSGEYESEHAACLDYLPRSVTLTGEQQEALKAVKPSHVLDDLVARRVVLDLPENYG